MKSPKELDLVNSTKATKSELNSPANSLSNLNTLSNLT